MERVLLVDDHSLFLDGLELLLKKRKGFRVVAKLNDPLNVVDFISDHRVTMVLADIQMPGINGIDLLKRIRSRFPDIKVVMISMHEEDDFIQEVSALGACGFLPKSMNSDKMVEEIGRIAEGEMVFPKKTRRVINAEYFSEREIEILRLLAKGKNSSEIAEQLFITLNTVKTHRKNMLRKINASNTSQLLRMGFDNNLI